MSSQQNTEWHWVTGPSWRGGGWECEPAHAWRPPILHDAAELENKVEGKQVFFWESYSGPKVTPTVHTPQTPERGVYPLGCSSCSQWSGLRLRDSALLTNTAVRLEESSLMNVQCWYQKLNTNSSQKKISMACGILSSACWMRVPPFRYFYIHLILYELLPYLLLTVLSRACLPSCHSPVLLLLPHNHWNGSEFFCLSIHQQWVSG